MSANFDNADPVNSISNNVGMLLDFVDRCQVLSALRRAPKTVTIQEAVMHRQLKSSKAVWLAATASPSKNDLYWPMRDLKFRLSPMFEY